MGFNSAFKGLKLHMGTISYWFGPHDIGAGECSSNAICSM